MSAGVRMKVTRVDTFRGFSSLHLESAGGDVHGLVLDVPNGPADVVPKLDEHITVFISWRAEGVEGNAA